MKNFILGFVAMIAVLVIGLLGYLRLGLAEVRADMHPPALETRLAQFAVKASVRRSAAMLQNPLQPTDETLIAGGKAYLNGCAGCHGKPGKLRDIFLGYPPPPQLFFTGTQYSEPELFWVVKHGIRNTGMSAYGPFYSDEKMWTLAAFVKRANNLPPAVLEGIQSKNP
jgi:mono/diheme cytochrome c family protein